MKRLIVIATLIASFAGSAVSAPAQGKSQGKGRGESNKPETKETGGLVFGGVEIRIIKDWFASPTNLKGLPPGLAKKESLPPGLEKQLRRNGSLPPGLEKKIQPLPRDLEVRLPRLPEGQRRVIISGSVILMDSKLNKILDVLANVF
jgi:hypothetical protein